MYLKKRQVVILAFFVGKKTINSRFINKDHIRRQLNTELIDEKIWKAHDDSEMKPAAVLFPFYWKNDQLKVLLTRRNPNLKHHSGQVSFPGGAFESSDGNIRNTALRETYEEVGIDPKDIEILGYLDNIQSISGFQVTPFVGEIKQGFSCQADSNEVSDVFGVPFEFFLDDNNRHRQQIKTNKGMRHYYLYKYNGYTIWGMTAQIIVQLVKRLKK